MNRLTIFLFILVLGFYSLTAQRNYKFENFGNRSILLNGNVTGSVDDLGATYYNPARLGLIDEPVFSINARIYELVTIKLDNVTLDGKNLSTSNFNGIPGMVAGSFKIKKLEGHQFAYAFFSRNRSDLSISYNSQIEENDLFGEDSFINKYVITTNIHNDFKENWYGLSWAKSISSNFSLGASLFFSTYKFKRGYSQAFNAISEFNVVSNYNSAEILEQKSYGFFAKIGAAWILKGVDLGLNIDLPYLEIVNSGKFKYEEFLSGFGSEADIFTFNDFEDLDATRKYPLGISIGSGIPIKKNKLHFNLSWNAKVDSYEKIDIPTLKSETESTLPIATYYEQLNSIINFGFGTEIYISKKLDAYGSFSSDYSPFQKNNSSESPSLSSKKGINFETDYFHYGFGVNVTHKWANFIVGTIYSSGNSSATKSNNLPIELTSTSEKFPQARVNRWRFVLGIEVLLPENSKLKKLGLDKKLLIN